MIVNYQDFQKSDAALKAVRGAYLVADLGNGGQERQLFNLVSHIAENNKVLIVPWDFNSEDRYVNLLENAPNILVLDLQEKGFRNRLTRIRHVLKATEASYFHSYSYHLNFVAWCACLGLGKRAIGGVRNRLVLNRKLNGKVRFYLSLLFPYFRISNNYYCFHDLGWPTRFLSRTFSNTTFVHNGVDTNRFRSSNDRQALYSNLNPLKTISVGRLFPVKQVDQIIDWVFEMKNRGFHVQHQHAGQGPEQEKLLQRVKQLQLENEFHFVGNVNDIPSFMSSAHFLVHAAKFEGCPNVIMEAMACGLPILSSDAGDTAIIVDQGENGFVYPIDDHKLRLEFGLQLAKDSGLLSQCSIRAAKKAQSEFGVSEYVSSIQKTYEQMGITT